jgi:putative oxidoreductase
VASGEEDQSFNRGYARANFNFVRATKESSMNSTQRYILAFSRVLVAMIFLLNGLGIVSQALAAKELVEHGALASLGPILMLGARTLEIVAGVGLIFGIYPRLAAVALLIFLVPSTVLAHAFWQVAGTATFTVQLLNFLQNTAMAGGLLFIGATPSQPTLLPRVSRSTARVQEKNERDPLESVRAS